VAIVIEPASHARQLARITRQAPLGTIILMAALGVTELVRLGIAGYRVDHPVPTAAAGTVSSRWRPELDIAHTIAGHLFGAAPVKDEPRDRTEAGGALLLSGVIATADPKAGSAIIGRQGQPTRLYQTGGSLQDLRSGRLYEVYADHVILDVDGHFETLQLAHSKGGTGAVLLAELTNSDEPAESEQPEVADIPDAHVQAVTLAQSLFENLNPAPKLVGGHFGGMRMDPSADDQEKFGVRNGDVVVAVNGVKLTGPNAIGDLLTDEDDSHATVSLTVLRNGTQQVILVTNAN
jgi:type II secretion system protein C